MRFREAHPPERSSRQKISRKWERVSRDRPLQVSPHAPRLDSGEGHAVRAGAESSAHHRVTPESGSPSSPPTTAKVKATIFPLEMAPACYHHLTERTYGDGVRRR